MIARLVLFILFVNLIVGCSTPRVIEATRLSDKDLSCESLKEEYRYAEQAKKDAENFMDQLKIYEPYFDETL